MKRFLRRGERGQSLVLFVGILTVIMAMGAISVDLGVWLHERRAMQTAADLATLAASQDLPVATPGAEGTAVARAFDFAKRNGYENGKEGATVNVELLCSNDLDNAPHGLCTGNGTPTHCEIGEGCDSIRVTISGLPPKTSPGSMLLLS